MTVKLKLKNNFIILFICLLLFLFVGGCSKENLYNKTIDLDGKKINISFYTKKDGKKILENIKKIYINYNNIIKEFDSNTEINYKDELKEIVDTGLKFKQYNKYIKFNPILKKNKILKNNSDISFFALSLANNRVKNYLKSKKITKFKINSNKFVLTGLNNAQEYYTILIPSFFDDSIITLKSKDEYIVTKSINDFSNKDTSNVSVTVISKNNDIKNIDFIASLLLYLPINEGKIFIKKYDINVIWYYYYNGKEKVEYTNINAY